MVVHNSFADFVLFLYIHMAYSDGEFHPSEKDVILKRIPKLFPGEVDPLKKMNDANTEYLTLDRSKALNLISETFKHFKEVKFAQKYKVYTDMYEIIHADGRVLDAEERAMSELKEIIDASADARDKT
jgi:uncharacterized tellurite resistance protein B-like protein